MQGTRVTFRPGRVAVGAVVALLVAGTQAAPAQAMIAPADRVADASFVLASAVSSGALTAYPDRTRVLPYLGSFAAWGLADQSGRTRDRALLDAAWRHLTWYADAQDARGYVTDQVVEADGSLTSTGDMDSTDAYAALFVLAADAAHRASRTVDGSTAARARLSALAPGLDGALRATESTRDVDGLTWAKPTWRVKYLMDQAEVYAGMQAAGRLFAVLGDAPRAARSRALADGVARGVNGLWDPATSTYHWAVHDGGGRARTDLAVLYPDAMEQVWAVAFGLVPRKRAVPLLARIAAAHPELSDPTATTTMAWGPDRVGYWPMAAAAWLQVGDVAEADRLLRAIDSSAAWDGRPWPFTSGNAGQVLVVDGRLLDR